MALVAVIATSPSVSSRPPNAMVPPASVRPRRYTSPRLRMQTRASATGAPLAASRTSNATPNAPGFVGMHEENLSPPDEKLRELRLAAERQASADIHEVKGASYQFVGERSDRVVLAETIRHLWPLFPDGLAQQSVAALYALDLGQTLGMLVCRPRERPTFTLNQHKRRAVMHREFRVGTGLKRNDAAVDITIAYGVTVRAIEDWRTDLRKDGFANIEADVVNLRLTGERFTELSGRQDRTEQEQIEFDLYDADWGEDGLIADGALFQWLSRTPRRKD